MMEEALFRLPDPLPEGAILVGPEDWPDQAILARKSGLHFTNPQMALNWLKNTNQGHSSARSRLIILHQDAFAGKSGSDQLCGWLEDVVASVKSCLPILLHADLSSDTLVSFFRAGLFDALSVPLTRANWVNMMVRAERKLEFRHQSQLILEHTGETREKLQNLRREIDDHTVRATSELLHSQESLQAANQQLAAAMDELSLLYQFGRKLSTARNWDLVLRELLKSLGDFVGSGGAALVLRSAQGGSYSPRQTWQWEESSWDKVLVNLQDQVNDAMAESMMAPGVFNIFPNKEPRQEGGPRIIALPLEHQNVRLGFLLLLFGTPAHRDTASRKFLPFLQTIQVMLGEEIASAQMLDRIRYIGKFNSRVLETVKSSIWVIDEEGRTIFCNRAGQELLTGQGASTGHNEEFFFQIGRGRLDQAPVMGQEVLPEIFLDARLQLKDVQGLLLPVLRNSEEGIFRGEGTIQRTDGKRIPVLTQSTLMPGRSHGVNWLVVVCEDLRDSRKLEVERLRADRLEGLVEMSATLAHEIRNPLMGLSAQAELLAEQLPPEDDRSRYIEVITGEVDRINETITRMLNFTRPYEPSRKMISVARLALDSVDLVRPRAEEKSVGLALDFDSPNLPGTGQDPWNHDLDGGQIKQVLLNLLINAIDASPADSVVSISLRQSRDLQLLDSASGTQKSLGGLLISVSDQGPGFQEGGLKKIFRPFYTTKSSGTGLGLSICQKIVTAHGGEIRAERKQDQTVFQVLLPQVSPEGDSSHQLKKEQA
jgi:signal transduction histidine kinase